MAFFNLTHMGPQDPFRNASGNLQLNLESDSAKKPEPPSGEGEESRKQKELEGDEKPRQHVSTERTDSGTEVDSQAHTSRMYSTTAQGSWHRGSHTKYTELLRKHQRNQKGLLLHVVTL